MNTLDQLARFTIAAYVDYVNHGFDDFAAEENALQEVQKISKEYRLVKKQETQKADLVTTAPPVPPRETSSL